MAMLNSLRSTFIYTTIHKQLYITSKNTGLDRTIKVFKTKTTQAKLKFFTFISTPCFHLVRVRMCPQCWYTLWFFFATWKKTRVTTKARICLTKDLRKHNHVQHPLLQLSHCSKSTNHITKDLYKRTMVNHANFVRNMIVNWLKSILW